MKNGDFITIELPFPPLLNQLYATNWTTKARFKSKKYKEWEADAMLKFSKGQKSKIVGDNWLDVDFEFYMPLLYKNGKKKLIDIDGFFKAPLDFLGAHIEGFDDSRIVSLSAKKIDSQVKKMRITIWETTKEQLRQFHDVVEK